MHRRVVWVQLIIGWLPLWALFTVMIMSAHGIGAHSALLIALRTVLAAALLAIAVQRLVEHYPWPRPMRVTFLIAHLGYACAYAAAWLLLNSLIESVLDGALVLSMGPSVQLSYLTGMWLYVMIAGVSYTSIATERAARAEANAAKAQLAAMRSQLHPHFLFNALHSVVQLIPREPRRATEAAELLADLLRTTIEEDRDLVTLAEECEFVQRYLALERMRFGDRLGVVVSVSSEAGECLVPVYSVQTLVENAVRHGAAPRIEPTEIRISGTREGDTVVISVQDDGVGAVAPAQAGGTGLRRLSDRLVVLYGASASLVTGPVDGRGFGATLRIPVGAAE